MYEKQIRKKLVKLNTELYRLSVKSEMGLMTKAEKKREADKLAKKYLAIYDLADCYDNPGAKSYVQNICLNTAMSLKYIAVSQNPKRKKATRKGYNIQRKVVTLPKDWRY